MFAPVDTDKVACADELVVGNRLKKQAARASIGFVNG
jgi:hypothetical protein